MEEADHGAFTAAKIQTVIPVRPKALADAVDAHLPGREIQDPLHMLVNRSLAAIGVGNHFVHKTVIPCFFYKLDDAADQPQGIIRTGILQPMDNAVLIRRGDHRRRLEGLLLFLRFKPAGFKQVQAIALARQCPQQFDQTAAAFFRVGMDDHHGILGRVPIA